MDMQVVTSPEDKDALKQYDEYKRWMSELGQALKRERKFRQKAQEAVTLYDADKETEAQYNILYSNTETLSPALYNSPPRPVVRRRFKTPDPIGTAAAKVAQRLLEYQLDNGSLDYPTFDELMRGATLSGLVPGRGVIRFRYEAAFEKLQNEQAAEAAEAEGVKDPGEESENEGHEGAEVVSYETLCGQQVPWDRFRHGYALTWRDVPWVAYESEMTKVELEREFGAAGVLVEVTDAVEDADKDPSNGKAEKVKGVKTATVFEIWDKIAKKVIFITPGLPEKILKEVPDPLELAGFFDCPAPVQFTKRVKGLVPIPPYEYYKEQAKELNRITVRLQKLIASLKVRGFYDSQVEGIEKALESEDNVLLPAGNLAQLQAGGQASLDKSIWLVPIEKIAPVVLQLYQQREQIKQVIFELTGLADIMRGSSQASETLGAQEIKNQWGTLRLKRWQKEVARYACDSLRIMAEIGVTKFSTETIAGMTGLQFPTAAQKQQAQAQMQQLQLMAQQAQLSGQQPPPPPKELPQLQQILSSPTWEEILGVLQNDLQRSFQIDIETNSTVDVEATEDKKDLSELLNAIAQFFGGVGPLMEKGLLGFDVVKGLLFSVVRRFRLGDEFEEQLQNMKPPEQGNPEAAKKQLEEMKKQIDAQAQKLQAEEEKLKADAQKLQQDQAQFEMDKREALAEINFAAKEATQEHKFQMKELQMEKAAAAKEITDTAKDAGTDLEQREFETTQKLQQAETGLQDKEKALTEKEQALNSVDKQQNTQIEQLAKMVQELRAEFAKRPTKAIKQADGSWATA